MGLFIGAAHAQEAAAEGATGMPQLAFETYGSQIFWLVVALVALYLLLTRVAIPRIAGVIEERHDAIADDLDSASEFKRQAEAAERAYESALAEARAKAQEIAAETRAANQKRIDEAIAKADAEIAAKTAESEARIREIRDSAMANVEEVAVETTGAVIAAVSPLEPDRATIESAVSAELRR